MDDPIEVCQTASLDCHITGFVLFEVLVELMWHRAYGA